MMTVTLAVEKRARKQKIDSKTKIKAVVYGPKQKSIPLAIDRKAAEKLYLEAGESTIIKLEGLGEDLEVLVHTVEFGPILSRIEHMDFYAIERGKELTTDVPLIFVGTAPAEDQDGILNKVLHEIEITCRPSALPKEIEVDVSGMTELDSVINVSDLKLPEGVKTTHEEDEVVAQISTATEEPEPSEEEMSIDDVEVEGEKPADESGSEEVKESD